MVRFVFNIVIFAIASALILADNACKLTTPDGTIDISSLSSTDGTPKYKDIQPVGSGFKYSYNPCNPFNEGEHCKGASVCQVDANGNDQFMLGTQDSAQWIAPPGPGSNWVLRFSYQNPSGLKTVNMNLACPGDGEAESFDFQTESPTNTYIFNWKNKCLCWNGCKGVNPTPGGGDGVTGGAVFLIILFSLLFLYFVAFLIINKFVRKQSGRDVIPHREFWTGIPTYTKDGVLYIVGRVTGKGGNYQSV